MTVNEICFDGLKIPEEEKAELLLDAIRSALLEMDPEDVNRLENIAKKFVMKATPMTNIKNFGRQGCVEVMGKLGIFLAALPENEMSLMPRLRRERRNR